MIEYALLFALGFLAATLVGLLVAPAIQRRIVAYTENRMKATTPLSPQEVRAQTDMARAAFAAENARVSQSLVREREKGTRLAVQNEALKRDVSRLAADNADLKAHIEDMNVDAGDLRSSLRLDEQKFAQLKAQLDAADREILHKKREIEILNANRDLVQSDLNDHMIALAAKDTEIENLGSRLLALRHERDKLVEGLRAAQASLKETSLKLSREENRARQLETKLAREQNQSAGTDAALERPVAEIGRLREKLKNPSPDIRPQARIARTPEMKPLLAAPAEIPLIEHGRETASGNGENVLDLLSLEADVRDRSAAITQRLSEAPSAATDAALREEMAVVAAKMIVLTDAHEGDASPIRGLLDQAPPANGTGRLSLASRAKDMLPPRG
ncbi:hypothetical protein SAMN05892877_103370 [Rhizobium subbaraonis]|uniref:Uncharacterized protein n=1 Tax=Rhizobium subbaraonis TaxID=908946 RepID=A0A285U5R7_9HYPH|nr:hypothetical protein [Rhizobium subbaraonis]SOC37027.1 hypothetical protein SAMN05892877_103370 [Rhizobium subbaraonis]